MAAGPGLRAPFRLNWGCGLNARGTTPLAPGAGLLRPSRLAGRPIELEGRLLGGADTEEPIPHFSVRDLISFEVKAG